MLTSSTAFDVTKGEDAPEIGATGPVTGIAYKDCSWKVPYKVRLRLTRGYSDLCLGQPGCL